MKENNDKNVIFDYSKGVFCGEFPCFWVVEHKPASRFVASEPDVMDQNMLIHMHTHTHT